MGETKLHLLTDGLAGEGFCTVTALHTLLHGKDNQGSDRDK